MKKNYLLISCLTLILFLTSCVAGLEYSYINEPIYIPIEKLDDLIEYTDPKKITSPGKIYLYKDYIFINEKQAGVHIIDNSNSSKPEKIGFLRIPLNEDIAVKDNVLYADTLGKIVTIDISDLDDIKVLEKIKIENNIRNYNIHQEKGLQIGYKRERQFKPSVFDFNDIGQEIPTTVEMAADNSPSGSGQGGSLARFSIIKDNLYIVTNTSLNLFDISNPKKSKSLGELVIDHGRRDIETIYPYQNKLFMGSRTGTYIYDNTNPPSPEFITKVDHTRSCDPVVAEGDKAYVTLKSGNSCQNGENKLDIIDFSNLEDAKIISSYPMTNPAGLAIDNKTLYVCDGSSGLKILDVKDPLKIEELTSISIDKPIDIILKENKEGIVISEEGLYQYDFSGLPEQTNVKELSFIQAEKNKIENIFSNREEVEVKKDVFHYKWYEEYFLD